METRAQKLWERGLGHFRQGNLEAARANFESFIGREPALAGPARFRISMIHSRRGRFRAAIDLAEQALAADPDQVELLTHLARCYLMLGEPEVARRLGTRALVLPKTSPVVLDSLGAVMTRLDEQVIAIELFDQAIALESKQASMFFNRALARKQFGLIEGAQRDLESCIAMNPAHAKAHWALSSLATQQPNSNHVPRLRQRLDQPFATVADEELLSLALFKELDDLSEVASAQLALGRGVASRRSRWLQAPHRMRHNVDALIELFDEKSSWPLRSSESAAPLFVFGMPRSGVALLGGVLSRHSGIHHLGSQQPFSRLLWRQLGREPQPAFDAAAIRQCRDLDFGELERRYLAAVTPATGKQLLVCESQPMNFLLAGFIAQAFPGARMLHVTRDPLDNCVSILAHAGGETSLPSHDPGALAATYLEYHRLMQHWHRVLPGRIMEVNYESLVEKPEMVLRVVCSFLGIRYASALRTGLQLHQRSIGRGQRYAPFLAPLQARLASPTGVANA